MYSYEINKLQAGTCGALKAQDIIRILFDHIDALMMQMNVLLLVSFVTNVITLHNHHREGNNAWQIHICQLTQLRLNHRNVSMATAWAVLWFSIAGCQKGEGAAASMFVKL